MNPLRRIYAFSIVGGVMNSGMAAAAFAHHDVAPGIWLIVLTLAMGAQAMIAQRIAKGLATAMLGGPH